jgi:hypothetical protein
MPLPANSVNEARPVPSCSGDLQVATRRLHPLVIQGAYPHTPERFRWDRPARRARLRLGFSLSWGLFQPFVLSWVEGPVLSLACPSGSKGLPAATTHRSS